MIPILTLAPAILNALSGASAPKTFAETGAYESAKTTAQTDLIADEINPADIEFVTEPAKNGEIVYTDEATGAALSKVGFPVKSVVNDDGTKIMAYTVSAGTPKIKDATVNSSNDSIGTLTDYIGRIQGDVIAKNILITPNYVPASINNTTLSYLRSLNNEYVLDLDTLTFDGGNWEHEFKTAGAWAAVAGPVNAVYTRSQDVVIHNWKPLYKYFCQYVPEQCWSDTYHNAYSRDFGEAHNFRDPMGRNCGIDLPHFFASIDGGYAATFYQTPLDGTKVPLAATKGVLEELAGTELRNLSSWAGDLQSTAEAYKRENISYSNDPLTILAKNSTEDDLLADMDAVNITTNHMKGVGFMSDAINDYYGSTKSMAQRYMKFVLAITGRSTYSCCALEDTVYAYLGLEKSGNVWVDSSAYTNRNDITSKVRFEILGASATTQNRAKVADAFCRYLKIYLPVC